MKSILPLSSAQSFSRLH
ncbi:hypothetical protein VCHENC02_5951A, partial [Vibrio harveyi]